MILICIILTVECFRYNLLACSQFVYTMSLNYNVVHKRVATTSEHSCQQSSRAKLSPNQYEAGF
jgi:hypothetical protein